MAAMQSAGLLLATFLLGIGLLCNTAVLFYFVLRSLHHLSTARRARSMQRHLRLVGAHR